MVNVVSMKESLAISLSHRCAGLCHNVRSSSFVSFRIRLPSWLVGIVTASLSVTGCAISSALALPVFGFAMHGVTFATFKNTRISAKNVASMSHPGGAAIESCSPIEDTRFAHRKTPIGPYRPMSKDNSCLSHASNTCVHVLFVVVD